MKQLTNPTSITLIFLLFGILHPLHSYAIGTVYLQNNTTNKFTLNITEINNNLDKGEHWGTHGSSLLEVGEKKRKILWYNRDQGITNKKNFYFHTDILDQQGNLVVTLQQKLRGTLTFSNYWMSVKNDSADNSWASGYDKQSFHFTYQNKDYTVQYKGKYNAGTASDDIEYVIHEVDPFLEYRDKAQDANQLSVLAYNIYAILSRTVWDINNRLDAMVDILPGYDVLVISEAFHNQARENLIANLSHNYPYATDVVDRSWSPEDGGVIILSRYPIEVEKQISYDSCNGNDCLAAKGVMYAQINKLGTPYHVFATHTQAWSTSDGRETRKKQFTQLKEFIDNQNIPNTEAVIIAGDLNVDRASYPDEYQDMLTRLDADQPFSDSTSLLFSSDDQKNNLADGQEYLDYVLFSRAHKQPTESSHSILLFKSLDNALWGSWDLSDHFPAYGLFTY